MDTLASRIRPDSNVRQVIKTWWPLAASWLLMSVEMPALSAVIARLSNPEINLAAYGGVVFPLSLIFEAPIIMLLAASTALSRDQQAYALLRKFMLIAGAGLTSIHMLVAFTPLYYVLVKDLIGVPNEIVEPARIGLMLMVPWSWSIAFRRFNQGIMIRYGYSRAVGAGTIVRLTAGGLVLIAGFLMKSVSGVAVGAAAQALGVMCEAIYAGWRVRPVIRQHLPQVWEGEALTWKDFASFYVPLALNSLLFLFWQPIGSAALSRMPNALASLAVWPVVTGLLFILRSFGMAYNEVVLALLGRPGYGRSLRQVVGWMIAVVTVLHLLLAVTPLAGLYFERVSALSPQLAEIARIGFLIGLPMPALSVLQSWFQGAILYSKRTRGIPESVVIFFVTVLLALGIGVVWNQPTGLYIGMVGFILANSAQAGWLWLRSRPVLAQLDD
jgi:hypothetical protein